MSAGGVVALVVTVLMLAVGVQQSILLWTGSDRFKFRESAPNSLPVPDSLWKHYVRAVPVIIIGGGISLVIAYVISVVSNGIGTAVFGLVVLVSVFVLAPMIFLFNKPKIFVPPGMRDQRGWIATRNGA